MGNINTNAHYVDKYKVTPIARTARIWWAVKGVFNRLLVKTTQSTSLSKCKTRSPLATGPE